MDSIGCLWNSAAKARLQLLPTVISTVHSHFIFRLRSARIQYHASSDHKARGFWKTLNVIWNLLVSALSVSLLHLSGILCPSVCGISSSLSSNLSSRLSFSIGFFFLYKFRWTMFWSVGFCLGVFICMREWCVLAHWIFLPRKHLRRVRAIHYYFVTKRGRVGRTDGRCNGSRCVQCFPRSARKGDAVWRHAGTLRPDVRMMFRHRTRRLQLTACECRSRHGACWSTASGLMARPTRPGVSPRSWKVFVEVQDDVTDMETLQAVQHWWKWYG